MAGGARHDEQMPDEMAVAQARIEREEDHPYRGCVGATNLVTAFLALFVTTQRTSH